MPTPTPAPDTDFVLDVYYPLVASGAGEAQSELVRRLATELPAIIDAFNERNSLSDGDLIPKPAGYKIAPNVPCDEDINQLLVGLAVDSEAQGIGGAFKNEIEVSVYSINYRIEAAKQVTQHWKRADLIRSALRHYLSGVVDPSGRTCWRSLVPASISMLPISEREYSGVVASFRMVIPPPTS